MRLCACLSIVSSVIIMIDLHIFAGLSVIVWPIVFLLIDSNPELIK